MRSSFLLCCFCSVALVPRFRCVLVPLLTTLVNAPITRIYRERPQDVAGVWDHDRPNRSWYVAAANPSVPLSSNLLMVHNTTRKSCLRASGAVAGEEMLVKFHLGGAPNAKFAVQARLSSPPTHLSEPGIFSGDASSARIIRGFAPCFRNAECVIWGAS